MDGAVLRAMAKWPNVPAVYGWLSLDRRGRWLIRGEQMTNRAALEFICRNYAADADGRWYFQNGPQRVFVSLDYAPWVLRLRPDGGLDTHTGAPVHAPQQAYVDEQGNLLIAFESGIGLVEDRDLEALSDLIGGADGAPMQPEQVVQALSALAGGEESSMTLRLGGTLLAIAHLQQVRVPTRFGFDPSPGDPGLRSE